MISSSTVSGDGSTLKNLFSTYTSEISSLENKSVWEGESQKNAIQQAEKFVSEFSGPIASQFNDFSSAADKYKDWEKAKKELEEAEDDYDDASSEKYNNPESTIDLEYYRRKVSEAKTKKENLKKEIDKLLASVKSVVLSASATTPKTSASYKLHDFVYFNQGDYHQGYGYGTTISDAGCGPTSMAMIATYLTGEKHDPVEMAKFSLDNHHRIKGKGTDWEFFGHVSKTLGINCERLGNNSDSLIAALKAGKPVISSQGHGTFTTGEGHFIVLKGLTSDGKVIVADPGSRARTKKTYDVKTIMAKCKALWAFDGGETVDMTI